MTPLHLTQAMIYLDFFLDRIEEKMLVLLDQVLPKKKHLQLFLESGY